MRPPLTPPNLKALSLIEVERLRRILEGGLEIVRGVRAFGALAADDMDRIWRAEKGMADALRQIERIRR
jgi:hypothetical protein